jgi:hypothetical protein
MWTEIKAQHFRGGKKFVKKKKLQKAFFFVKQLFEILLLVRELGHYSNTVTQAGKMYFFLSISTDKIWNCPAV